MWVGWRRLSTESAGVGEKRLWLTGLIGQFPESSLLWIVCMPRVSARKSKVKCAYSSLSELRLRATDVTCHMGLHSVTCCPTQVNAPRLNPRHAGQYLIYLPCRDIRLNWPRLDDVLVYSCVIAELFTEGTSPFDLSQLLAYRSGEYSPSKLFQSIDDANIRVSSCSFIFAV